MSDAAEEELRRRLISSVREERPSPALREHLLVLARREQLSRSREQQGHTRVPSFRRARLWAAGVACAAGVVALVTYFAEPWTPISISAEHPSSRGTPPESPVPRESSGEHAPALQSDSRADGPESAAPKKEKHAPREPRSVPTEPSPEPRLEAPAQPARPASAPPSLSAQLAQLKAVRAALRRGDPAHALRLLDEYGAETNGSELAAEATFLRIEALAASSRRAEAAREARRFILEYPTSPMIDRAHTFSRVDAGTSAPKP